MKAESPSSIAAKLMRSLPIGRRCAVRAPIGAVNMLVTTMPISAGT